VGLRSKKTIQPPVVIALTYRCAATFTALSGYFLQTPSFVNSQKTSAYQYAFRPQQEILDQHLTAF
jgi:hypothetical protein